MKTKMDGCSDAAKVLWDSLTQKERAMIQKNYPNLKIRDRIIGRLRSSNGARLAPMAEITGLSDTSISRIGIKYKTIDAEHPPTELIEELKKHKEIFVRIFQIVNS